ncbi:MAG: hypothetical protein K8T25_02725 [Planctomycetia bacterium]|nr:hypothetical protein [Planctomycetia bacterium]
MTSSRDGNQLARLEEQTMAVVPTLSFQDGTLQKFDTLMKGAVAGEKRTGKLKLSEDAPNEELRGKEIELEFEVLDVKKFVLPELSHEFLQRLPYGPFAEEAELRKAIEQTLTRQLAYQGQQRAREQITRLLTESAKWDLPPEMLKRQSERELDRAILEMRRSGYSDVEIRAHENRLRQNNRMETARALREHFILERIAEEEKIEAEPGDYDDEIRLIAAQSGESPRRMRAQLEKRGLMDSLHNQIIERKTIERVLKEATFTDVPFVPPRKETEAVNSVIGGGSNAEIPEAQHSEEAKSFAAAKTHHQ